MLSAHDTLQRPAAIRPVPYPSRASAYYVSLILFCATAFSYLDSQVLTLLVDPIRADLGISDTKISALYGFAPHLLIAVIGISIGRLVDTKKRKYVLAGGILMWSIMTALCGLATGYWSLFAARVGVGVGMACLSPMACSLLADCFEPRLRSRAINVYLIGIYAGQGLSSAIGGALFDFLQHSAHLPLIGGLAAWRQIFIIVGVPGLAIALFSLSMPEPARQEVAVVIDATSGKHQRGLSLVQYIRRNLPTFAAVFVAEALFAATAYALTSWAPTYFIRMFGLPPHVVGRSFGLLLITCGTIGGVVGSILCDRWTARGVRAAKFRVCALGMTMAAPAIALLPFAPNATSGFACVGVCLIFLPFGGVASMAMVQEIFPNQLRGQGNAVALLLQSLLGSGCGPILVGLASDYLFHGPQGLAFSITSVGLPAIALFLIIFAFGQRNYEATRAQVGELSH